MLKEIVKSRCCETFDDTDPHEFQALTNVACHLCHVSFILSVQEVVSYSKILHEMGNYFLDIL